MKKIVCLVLTLCLLLCAAGAMAATVNDVSIDSESGTGWKLIDGILYINEAKKFNEPKKYVIRNWTGKGIIVVADVAEETDVAAETTLELHNVTLDYGLMHEGTSKLKVVLADSYVSGVEVERYDDKPINVVLSGSGTIAGAAGDRGGVYLVSTGGGNVTVEVSGSLTITGKNGLRAHSIINIGSGDSGAVTVTVSGGSVEGQWSGIVAQSNSGYKDVNKSGSVSVSVSGGAKVTGKDKDDHGIYAERTTWASAEGDMVSVSVDGAVVTGGDSGIYISDQILGDEKVGKMSVTASGGAQIIGESQNGVELRSELTDQDDVTVTLKDNATVQGESGAIGFVQYEDHETKGKVFVNASKGPTAFYINEEHQGDYVGQNDVTDNVQVQDAKKLRLGEVLVNDGAGAAGEAEPDAVADLPQTGDSSSLALWGALLALAGAGMMVARKREA